MEPTGTIPWLAYTIIAIAIPYGAFVVAYQPYRRFPILKSAVFTSLTDATLIVLWITGTGGFESPFFVLWYVSIAAIAFRFSYRATLLVATLYAAAYFAALTAEGAVPTHLDDVVVRISYIFFVAMVGGYLSKETLAQTTEKLHMRDLMLETRRAEQQLREQEAQNRTGLSLLHATLDSTADGILVVGLDGRISLFNKRWQEMWNIDPNLLSTRDNERVRASVLPQLRNPDRFLRQTREMYADVNGERFDTIEFADGRVFERYSIPQRIDGRVVGRVLSFRDVTAQRKAERDHLENIERAKEVERLRELDLFKTRFMNSVAHELWTPLTPIQIQLHMLRNGDRGPVSAEQAASIEMVSRNMDRLQRMVSEMLDGARYQAGRFRVHRAPTNLYKVVHELIDLFQGASAASGIRLEAQLDPELPIEGDANRLTQVMYNLLSNALKFTSAGGAVRVDAWRDGAEAHVAVRDTGIGLSAAQIEKLFQAFSQAHDAMQRTKAGTGLGLYISRAVIEAHDGRIWCESPGPNRGTTFHFTIPLRTTAPTMAAPARVETTAAMNA